MRILLAWAVGLVTAFLAISFLLLTLLNISLAMLPNGTPPGMPINLNFIIWITSFFFGGLAGLRVYEFIRGPKPRPEIPAANKEGRIE